MPSMGRNPTLTPEQVKRARALYSWRARSGGLTIPELAKIFNVSNSTIFKAVNRVAPYGRARSKKEGTHNAKNPE